MSMGNVFAVQAMMSLGDFITGPLKKIQGTMGEAGRSSDRLGGKMGTLAKAMLPLVVAAGVLVAGFGACVAATLETQAALGELASVGITDMAALAGAAEDFSGQWAGTTKSEFIAAAYDIKSGISTLSDTGVAEFTKLAALTGKATKSTTSEMTSLFATGYGIYKGMYADLTDMQFGEVFSAGISASVKNFKTTGSGMAQAISSLGATATTAKVPLAEQLSILGMLQATMSGSEAGTKYKAMMNAAAGAGQELNLQFMDSNNQLLAMPEILTAMKGKYGATLDAVEKMEIEKAFGTQEAVAVIDLLYGKLDDLTGNITGMESAMGQGTATTQAMAEAMNQDLGAALQLNGQKWHNLKETIGTVFVSVVRPVVAGIGRMIDGFSALAKNPVGKVFILIAGGVAVATLAFAAFAAAGAALGVVVPFVTASLLPLGAAVAAISWPVWLIVGAVVVLALAWKKNFGGMADVIAGWWTKINLVVRGVKAVFASLTGTVGSIEGQLATDIKANGLVGLVSTVAGVVYRISQLFGGLWGGFVVALEGITGILSPVVETLVDAFRPLWQIITYVTSALFGASAATDASGWRTFGAVVGVIVGSAFKLLAWGIRIALIPLSLIIKVVGGVLSAFVALGEGIGTAVGWIVGHVSAIGDGIKWVFMNLTPLGWMIQAFSGIKGFLEGFDLSEAAGKVVGTIGSGIKWAFMNLTPLGWLIQAFSGIKGFLEGFDLSEAAGKVVRTIGSGIKWAFMNLTPLGWMIQAFSGVKGFLENFDLAESGAKLIGTLVAGIKSKLMAPVTMLKSGLTKLRNLLPFSDAKEGPLSTLTLSGARLMETIGAGVRTAAPGLMKTVSAAMAGVAAFLGIGGEESVSAHVLPPQAAIVQQAEVVPPVLPELAGQAAWQGQDVAAPVLPELAGRATWQGQDVPAPVLPELAGQAAWQGQDVAAPALPDLAGRATWQGQDVATPALPDLAGRATWQGQDVAAPVLPELTGRAAWQGQDVAAPVLPELAGRATWQGQDVAAPALPELAGQAVWQGQDVTTPMLPEPIVQMPGQGAVVEASAVPDASGRAFWQNDPVSVPVMPDLVGEATWQSNAGVDPVIPEAGPSHIPAPGDKPVVDQETQQQEQDEKRDGNQGNTYHIHIANLTLPDVKNPHDFMAGLAALVEANV